MVYRRLLAISSFCVKLANRCLSGKYQMTPGVEGEHFVPGEQISPGEKVLCGGQKKLSEIQILFTFAV